jgi:hypothetical protein
MRSSISTLSAGLYNGIHLKKLLSQFTIHKQPKKKRTICRVLCKTALTSSAFCAFWPWATSITAEGTGSVGSFQAAVLLRARARVNVCCANRCNDVWHILEGSELVGREMKIII